MSWSSVAWQLDDVHSPNSVSRASINLHLAHRMQKNLLPFSWKQTSPTPSAIGTLFRIYGNTKILLSYSVWSKISFLCVCKRAFIGSNLLSFSRSPGLWILTKLHLLTFFMQWLAAALLLIYSDRIAQDFHLIPFSDCFAENSQHFICSIWNYTDVILPHLYINVKEFQTKFLHFLNFSYCSHRTI